jgi:hypothetical protein
MNTAAEPLEVRAERPLVRTRGPRVGGVRVWRKRRTWQEHRFGLPPGPLTCAFCGHVIRSAYSFSDTETNDSNRFDPCLLELSSNVDGPTGLAYRLPCHKDCVYDFVMRGVRGQAQRAKGLDRSPDSS